jgi:D,D-heptose 1,7-bisphosphate phosphatase
MIRAVFLDKAGTLVEHQPLQVEPTRMHFVPDVLAGLRLLRRAGYALVVVTHQGDVAQGCSLEPDLQQMKSHVRAKLAEAEIPLDGFYYCPHRPDGSVKPYAIHCLCRKPQPGLLIRAASDLAIDMTRSWMIGATLHDIEAGLWGGCRTILLTNGHEREWYMTEVRWPDYIAGTLLEAAQLIALSSPREPLQPLHSRLEEER